MINLFCMEIEVGVPKPSCFSISPLSFLFGEISLLLFGDLSGELPAPEAPNPNVFLLPGLPSFLFVLVGEDSVKFSY